MSPDPTPAVRPLDLLMACHARMRRYLAELGALARHDAPGDRRAIATAEACRRYFRDGLPLHGQDEDLSLAPRLRALDPEPGLLAALDRLEEEHAAMEAGLPALLALLDEAAAGRAADLVGPHRWLADLLDAHMALEEAQVFPAIDRLSAADQQQLVQGIRRRRSPV